MWSMRRKVRRRIRWGMMERWLQRVWHREQALAACRRRKLRALAASSAQSSSFTCIDGTSHTINNWANIRDYTLIGNDNRWAYTYGMLKLNRKNTETRQSTLVSIYIRDYALVGNDNHQVNINMRCIDRKTLTINETTIKTKPWVHIYWYCVHR